MIKSHPEVNKATEALPSEGHTNESDANKVSICSLSSQVLSLSRVDKSIYLGPEAVMYDWFGAPEWHPYKPKHSSSALEKINQGRIIKD